ncbi:MAG: Acyl-CoA dehydrogenase [Acidimicrobiia bacterium]|nr:Acyl-CoA dehydrogenase [Acidimicrobiia bacterium]
MTIALIDEHRALADVARSFLTERGATAAARATLEAPSEVLPPFWKELCDLGWTGLHLPEAYGGQGYGLFELAIVVEELGRAVAPGPFLPTTIASAAIAAVGSPAQQAAYLPGLADGSQIAAIGLAGSLTRDGNRLRGDGGLVLGGALADLLVLRVGADLVVVDASASGLKAAPHDCLDPTRRLVSVTLDDVEISDEAVIIDGVAEAERVAWVLAAAEAAGGARACTEMAVEYAKVREQFGRPIGSFQAIKHHCAEMLVASELAAAVVWDTARANETNASTRLGAAGAATQALPGYVWCAEKNIQIHGGIGYTWEHDAHIHLRRAMTLAAVFGASKSAPETVAALTAAGTKVNLAIDLPPEAEDFRAEARAFRARYDALPQGERRAALIESGYLLPHWPKPYGRGAGVVEQLVLDEELDGVEQPGLGIGSWVVLTLVQHGTPDQLERWIGPSLRLELYWCQLFSEPNAGSDAAAISTKATKVDGGWLVNGQKVWTSGAQHSNRGLATVRTDFDAPKHAGVTMLAIDMKAPGVEIRPLREITGETLFNEVFFTDVFVPDEDVVGEVNQGWTVARATLGNERVSIGGNKGGLDMFDDDDLMPLANRYAPGDLGVAREVGNMLAERHGMTALNLRHVARTLAGGPPGPEGNVTKLLSAEHAQRVSQLGMKIAGTEAIAGQEPVLARSYLFAKCLTIAGGTSEIVRNLIAERLLGLPRDKYQK